MKGTPPPPSTPPPPPPQAPPPRGPRATNAKAKVIVGVIAGVLLLATCGAIVSALDPQDATTQDDDVGSAGREQSGDAAETPQEQAFDDRHCEKVSDVLLDAIATGLTTDGRGTLGDGYAVRSRDFDKVWMVAADIDAPSMNGPDEIAVWATNSRPDTGIGGIGLIAAADAFAKEFSDWGEAANEGSALYMTGTEHGIDQAKRCVRELARD